MRSPSTWPLHSVFLPTVSHSSYPFSPLPSYFSLRALPSAQALLLIIVLAWHFLPPVLAFFYSAAIEHSRCWNSTVPKIETVAILSVSVHIMIAGRRNDAPPRASKSDTMTPPSSLWYSQDIPSLKVIVQQRCMTFFLSPGHRLGLFSSSKLKTVLPLCVFHRNVGVFLSVSCS